MNIGNKISYCRKKMGMSQEKLASELNISRQAVSRWETGEAVPDTEKIKLLCNIFHVSADYLLFDELEEASSAVGEARQIEKLPDAKVRFRIAVYIAVLVAGILLIVSALILALIETYQPYQSYYTTWGPFGTHLFRSWRVIPFILGLLMSTVGIIFLHDEYKKL